MAEQNHYLVGTIGSEHGQGNVDMDESSLTKLRSRVWRPTVAKGAARHSRHERPANALRRTMEAYRRRAAWQSVLTEPQEAIATFTAFGGGVGWV